MHDHPPASQLAPIEAPALDAARTSRTPSSPATAASRPASMPGSTPASARTTTASAVLENRARAARHLGVAPERLATPHQVHGTDARDRRRGLGARATGRRPTRVVTRPAGHRHRRRRGRLRSGALRRPRGARRRRRPCRLEGRARRRPRIDGRGDGAARRGARRASSPCSARRSPPTPTRSDPNSSRASPKPIRPMRASSARPARPGHAMFDLPAYIVARLRRPASARRDDRRPLHLCRRGALLLLSSRRRIAASRTTAACSPPSRSREA